LLSLVIHRLHSPTEENVGDISRVLCAVDIDDSTCSAFRQALAIASARNARLLLVCAVPPEQPFSRRATDRLAYLLKVRREAEAAGVDVHVSVQTGETAEIVLLHASARQADLIVVAVDHGRGEGRPWGAVAEDVLRSARCATLIVPAGAAQQPAFANILCAVDLAGEPAPWLDDAMSLASPRERRITVLHVAGDQEAGRPALQRLQAVIPQEARSAALARVTVGAVAPEVLKSARSMEADLLVIGARRRSRITRRLFGVTRELLATSCCPVLAIPVETTGVRRTPRVAA
jgi:nucleotide-binding universal stress UspA family protein